MSEAHLLSVGSLDEPVVPVEGEAVAEGAGHSHTTMTQPSRALVGADALLDTKQQVFSCMSLTP